MNNEEKIAYLNQIIFSKFGIDYKGPKLLYKYRPFDKYTFDMLENEYIFLCPAKKEDDETGMFSHSRFWSKVSKLTEHQKLFKVNS